MTISRQSRWAALGVVLGMGVVAAAAQARPRPFDGAPASAIEAPHEQSASRRTPALEEIVADPGLAAIALPAAFETPGHAAPPPQEGPDWGNPYDVLLHGIELGPTQDMRR
jgi:hypothetical protein